MMETTKQDNAADLLKQRDALLAACKLADRALEGIMGQGTDGPISFAASEKAGKAWQSVRRALDIAEGRDGESHEKT